MTRTEISAEEARHLLTYEPGSGVLRWKVSPARNVFAGDVAGCSSSGSGYLDITIRGKAYRAHRLIWLLVHGRWPAAWIDHIDGNKLNNRLANLREATRIENRWNTPAGRNNSTGVVGVYRCSRSGKYRAFLATGGRRMHLGLFTELQDAAKARREAELQHFGKFAPGAGVASW